MATEKENLIRAYMGGIKDGADAALDMDNGNKLREEIIKETISFGKAIAEETVDEILNPRPRRVG